MNQVICNVRTGQLAVVTVPPPTVQRGCVLVANAASVISPGTEKATLALARRTLLGKARERRDLLQRTIQKLQQEGLVATWSQIQETLDRPLALGYSSAGTVLACGDDVREFKPGDRVAVHGPHAGVVCVPRHLCARVPDNVPLEDASLAVIGAIGLHGLRLAGAGLGETVFVIGLGLVGQMAVALARAQGCRVIASDPDAWRCGRAKDQGAHVVGPDIGPEDVCRETRGLGADAVLITAAAASREPLDRAVASVRKKGRIVLTGVADVAFDRRALYFKEAEFVVSCSYGPGRYDPVYEQQGCDYPPAYVRWTEQRNVEAVLELMGRGALSVAPLLTHRFPVSEAQAAYDLVEEGRQPYLAVLLTYEQADHDLNASPRCVESGAKYGRRPDQGKLGIGVLGAGQHARRTVLPILRRLSGFRRVIVGSAGGVSAVNAADKFGFELATTDEAAVCSHPEVHAVFILTRHGDHARQVIRALRAGKDVFVEKPMCLTIEELQEIERCLNDCGGERTGGQPLLWVGFNRRFAPLVRIMKEFFGRPAGPMTISIRFNAGAVPPDHWIHDEMVGGDRIRGEACHGVDLAAFLCGAPPVRVYAESAGGRSAGASRDDESFILLRHADGSVSTIAYWAGGDRALPKERIEVAGGGAMAILDDYRTLTLAREGRVRTHRSRWDKGHRGILEAFDRALHGDQAARGMMTWNEMRSVTLASILAVRSLREGLPFDIP